MLLRIFDSVSIRSLTYRAVAAAPFQWTCSLPFREPDNPRFKCIR